MYPTVNAIDQDRRGNECSVPIQADQSREYFVAFRAAAFAISLFCVPCASVLLCSEGSVSNDWNPTLLCEA